MKTIHRMGKLALVALILASLLAPICAEAASYIGVSRAKSIALKRAGKTKSQVRFTKAHRERDDGRMIYDVEFYLRDNRRMEYDFEINARTGRIIEWERDYDDDWD